MTVREEEQMSIRRLAQVVRRVRQIFELPSGLPPEGGQVAAHEERPECLRRPREVHDVTRMQKPEDLKGVYDQSNCTAST